jgi:hypothetical protein
MHKGQKVASVLHIGIITGTLTNVLHVGSFVGIPVIKTEPTAVFQNNFK